MAKQKAQVVEIAEEQVVEKVNGVDEMTAQIIEELSSQIETLKNENETLRGVLKEARPVNENGKKTKSELPEPFEFEGKIIKITKRAFMFEGAKVTAQDLKINQEMIAKLLGIKSNILEVVSQ